MSIINFFSETRFARERKTFENEKTNGIFLNYSEINSVLLVFDIKNDKDISIFEHLANILKADQKKVVLCGFVEQSKSVLKSEKDKIIIKKEDISFWQKPKKEFLNSISERQFDAVFLLSTKKSIPVMYALMNTDTKIKCGGISVCDLLDFIIDTSNIQFADETYIFDNIIRYLKMINKN